MKYKTELWALLLVVGIQAHADPLKYEQIAPDAKWLVHLDCDNLRQTQLGGFLLTNVLGPKLAEATGDVKFNVSNVLQQIKSVTAYGTDFNTGAGATGVLLINTDAETKKVIEGVLAAQMLANTNGPIKQLEEGAQPLYTVADQGFISPQEHGPIIISRSKAQIEAARELLAGKGPSLASTKSIGEFPAVSNGFFFVGLANAIDLPNSIPAQAKVLQMANGGRLVLGEKADQVFLELALRGKTPEVTRQIQQVIEGMVALVSLGQPDNPDLVDLVKSTKVSAADQLITISVHYPVGKVIAKLNEQVSQGEQGDKPEKPHKAHAKAKQKKAKSATTPSLQPEAGESDK